MSKLSHTRDLPPGYHWFEFPNEMPTVNIKNSQGVQIGNYAVIVPDDMKVYYAIQWAYPEEKLGLIKKAIEKFESYRLEQSTRIIYHENVDNSK